jgi:oxygen-dependent protoporphyrinogen oxidase
MVVIGGGISGLAAAHRLQELAAERSRPIHVCLLEAGPRLGGLVGSERRDGFLLEWGPDSFITDKPWALALCRRLGLADELIGTNAAQRRSFIAWRGRLLPIPEGFQVLAPARLTAIAASPLFTPWGKLRMAGDLLVPRRREEGDESVGDFVTRRLGREALERLAQPLVAGIYGADPFDLSLEATLPRFRRMEEQHGSLVRALRAPRAPGAAPAGPGISGARYGLFATFREGMQTLTDHLAARLPADCARANTYVVSIQAPGKTPPPAHGPAAPSPYALRLADGTTLPADGLCLAIPAHAASQLLADVDPALAQLLDGIRYASTATVNLAYRRADLPRLPVGFGFVVPALERSPVLGCTFASNKFTGRAPADAVLLRAFLGGAAAEQDEAALVAAARTALQTYLDLAAAPLWESTHRWPRSMPHYQVGHLDRVAQIDGRVAALARGGLCLALAGNAYRGIGIPDSIHSGEEAAERLIVGSEVAR